MLYASSFNACIQIQKISTAGQYAFDILTGLLRDEICCNAMSKVYMKRLKLLKSHMSRIMRKPKFWFLTWSNTNHAVRSQKIDTGLKFRN